ncbi:outer membrane beta-barrel protein [Pedobacter metabolipauper]|nr:outer membrane beta-barrel protein [Pedobacter metabolipauper]
MIRNILFSLIFLCLSFNVQAQKKDSIYVGLVDGLVRDSVHNYVLKSATLSIYRADNAQLLSYQLANNFGKFQFKELPVGIRLRITASYIGYQSISQEFIIPANTRKIILKAMNLERAENNLQEVNIVAERPPVRMKGDTLEFNADAFKLDTNAVVEDLLRKLPGVTIWSDGLITVNGKKISNVLVDGKLFFGGDTKIATQNLPKNAVDKIQVYTDKEDKNVVDPNTNLNIVLKKDKKDGYFGKIGMGYGTDKRYAFDGMLSGFTAKTQLSLVGSRNNVNKTANDVQTLIGYSSFKGEGIEQDYQSDFSKQGLNEFSSGGATFAHEFNKKTSLKADYFYSDSQNEVLDQVQTLVTLNENALLVQDKVGTSVNGNTSHRASANYTHNYEQANFYINSSLQGQQRYSQNAQVMESLNTETNAQSKNKSQQDNEDRQTGINLFTGLAMKRYYDNASHHSKSINLEVVYKYGGNKRNYESTRITEFTSNIPGEGQYFNRKYKTDENNASHSLSTNFSDLLGLLNSGSHFFTVNFKNELTSYDSREETWVGDLNTGSQQYISNANLTNTSHYRSLNERPGLEFTKSITKSLSSRYSKTWSMNFFAQARLFDQKNNSDKAFQKLDKSYAHFIPAASINYKNDQYGHYYHNYSLNYTTSVSYPGIYQLAPIVDDANVYYLHLGNPVLKPAYTHEAVLKFTHAGGQTKNSEFISVNLTAGITKDHFSDSSNYDALGRNVHYTVNVSDRKYIGYYGSLYEVYNIKDHQFQVSYTSSLNYGRNPGYINGSEVMTKSLNTNNQLSLGYSFKGLVNTGLSQSLLTYNRTQQGSSDNSYKNLVTGINAGLNWPKNVFISSNLNYNKSISSYAEDVNFTIWNANVGYRFLKGNNGEVKFSALDLLHQNTSIINYGDSNSITRGTVNVLQQYFMVSLAYYPRKFGSIKK